MIFTNIIILSYLIEKINQPPFTFLGFLIMFILLLFSNSYYQVSIFADKYLPEAELANCLILLNFWVLGHKIQISGIE